MSKKIIIDHNKCTGCYMCGQACSLIKTGTFNPAASRIRIVDWEDSGITVPVVCQHCAEPVCMPACPKGAIRKDAATGLVSIDEELCVNCRVCRSVCPYAGPVYSPNEKQVVLCDHCGGKPTCVGVCPTSALLYGDVGLPGEKQTSGDKTWIAALGMIRETIVKKEGRK